MEARTISALSQFHPTSMWLQNLLNGSNSHCITSQANIMFFSSLQDGATGALKCTTEDQQYVTEYKDQSNVKCQKTIFEK